MHFTLLRGDCIKVMAGLPENSVDAIVTDPPYGIRFMGKAWDGADIKKMMERKSRKKTIKRDKKKSGKERHKGCAFSAGTYDLSQSANLQFQLWTQLWATEALRILKPGGFLISFSSPRTYHRMVVGIEDAGFDIRDQLLWLFGSGFPKSHNLKDDRLGWGTALKPAHEPIVMARKPFKGTVALNVEKWGTGAINVNGCRIPVEDDTYAEKCASVVGLESNRNGSCYGEWNQARTDSYSADGRWPANVLHDGTPELIAMFPDIDTQHIEKPSDCSAIGSTSFNAMRGNRPARGYDGNGSAARFFYCAKASRFDREEGCDHLEKKPLNWSSGDQNPGSFQSEGTDKAARNYHPTVKPTELMRWLCRLVTPPGGIVLDPFMGSGSTGKASVLEGFTFMGIEMAEEYIGIARARITHAYDLLHHPEEIIKKQSADVGQMTIFDVL